MKDKDNLARNIISNLSIDKVPIRKIYDDSIKFIYKKKKPLEIKEKTIYRCMVNDIRHNHTNYDMNLKKIYKIDDIDTRRYYMYKNATLDIIAENYPSLKEECNNQKTHVIMARYKKKRGNKNGK